MNQYEIFTAEADLTTKSTAIDSLLGYPNAGTQTTDYRSIIKHNTQNLWAGVVDDNLVAACASMSAEDRATYYDDSDLKTGQYLVDNDWYPPFDPTS